MVKAKVYGRLAQSCSWLARRLRSRWLAGMSLRFGAMAIGAICDGMER